MHLGYVWFSAAVLAVVGGIVGGGAFTLILVPVGLIVLAVWVVLRLTGLRKPGDDIPGANHTRRHPDAVPQTPDELVDARQRQQ